jgi:hypothetical protein
VTASAAAQPWPPEPYALATHGPCAGATTGQQASLTRWCPQIPLVPSALMRRDGGPPIFQAGAALAVQPRV